MPKGKRKGKSDKMRGDPSMLSSDEDSLNDNASIISAQSESRSVVDDENGEIDEVSQQEVFEEKLVEAIDGLVQKSAQARTACLELVCTAFIKKFVPEFVHDRRLTLCDSIEKSLRKGRGAEQISAAKLAPLLCVQLGATDDTEEICNALRPVLSVTANDNSMTPIVRAKCCISLGLVMFLSGGEIGDVILLMRELETMFSGSYLRGDGSTPSPHPDIGTLHAAALSSWSLLLTLLSPSDVYAFMGEYDTRRFSPSLEQLSELLLSPHLDVRLSAGEALAIAYEMGREYNEDFAEDFSPELIETLRQLATDSHKYRAKKDRKTQRATFRDVLRYIEEFETYEDNIRVGCKELLVLDGWVRRKHYDALCGALGPGLQVHLNNNDLLREIFSMGAKPVMDTTIASSKQSKLERHLMNAAAFKARTISRAKNRDKRSAVVSS